MHALLFKSRINSLVLFTHEVHYCFYLTFSHLKSYLLDRLINTVFRCIFVLLFLIQHCSIKMKALLSLVDRMQTHMQTQTCWWMSSFTWASSKSNHLTYSSRLICKSANWIFDWPSRSTRWQLLFVDAVVDFSVIRWMHYRLSLSASLNCNIRKQKGSLMVSSDGGADPGKGSH